jgi:hypothetical protein
MGQTATRYYTDLLNDDFSGIVRDRPNIGPDYEYISHNPLWNIAAFFVYRVFVFPYAFFYMKLKFHLKVVNRKAFKKFRDQGFFLFGNHTQVPGDGFLPSLLTFPKKDYVIVSPENVALKGTKNLMMMLGALPIPTSLKGMRNFLEAVEKRSVTHHGIVVYPEAHVWPYYTKIRPFKADSFAYPAMFSDVSFCFTVTYQKRKFSSIPKMTVYIDGPFYPDFKLSSQEQKVELRDRIYKTMVERSKNSNYEYIHYEMKKDSPEGDLEK